MHDVKQQELISVIVPVYNVEKYVEQCIVSIINQTYKNLEIILVNDGSMDNSAKVCDAYVRKDSRIRVLHKENGGLADARNAGMKIATGDYLAFIDSDDWITHDYIEYLYKMLIDFQADISICGFTLAQSRETIAKKVRKESYLIWDKPENIKQLLYQRVSTAACAKLFRREIFDGILFPKGKLYEDLETVFWTFTKSNKVVYGNAKKYLYFQRHDSIVGQSFNLKKMDYVYNAKNLLECIRNLYPEFEDAAISRLLWAEIHILVHINEKDKYVNERNEMWKDIKRYRVRILNDNECGIKVKAVLILSLGGEKLLKCIFNAVRKR